MAEYILQYGKYGVCTSKRQITIDMSEKPIEYYLDQFYPVGTYYTTMDETFDPNVSFVGTWVRDTDGLVTVAASDDSLVGTTGGEVSHKLTENEMPSHQHTSSVYSVQRYNTASYGDQKLTSTTGKIYGYGSTQNTSYPACSLYGTVTMTKVGDDNHNNVQRSQITVRWHRIE